jgi:hypothetical protein
LWHYNGISNSKVDKAACTKVLVSLPDPDFPISQGQGDPTLKEVIQTKWPGAVIDYLENAKPPRIV